MFALYREPIRGAPGSILPGKMDIYRQNPQMTCEEAPFRYTGFMRSRSPRRQVAVFLTFTPLVALAATLGTSSPTAAHPSAVPSADDPCGVTPTSTYTNVMWIWMGNQSYSSVVGAASAPYLDSLVHKCGVATDYVAVAHPSLPNSLAATGGSTFGVTNDNSPNTHPIQGPSIFSQVSESGKQWRSYVESMPSPCDLDNSNDYAVERNPAAYYVSLGSACSANDVPMGSIAGGTLIDALHAADFPNFAFVVPNLCNSMSTCSVGHGDTWLSHFLPLVFNGHAYRAGHMVVFITWGQGPTATREVPAVVAAPSVPHGTRSAAHFTHYSLLRTTDDLLGLAPLRDAAGAPAMTSEFHL